MPEQRSLPVRPDLDQLRRQAKELLSGVRARDPESLAEFARHHPGQTAPADAKLADAQLALARAYEAESWPRLVQACQLANAIWEDDLAAVRKLVTAHPNLIRENTLIRKSNWGPPLSYAATVGRDRIIELLRSFGADDLEYALGRAMLKGWTGTARKLHAMMGKPTPPADALSGPAYTLSIPGTAFALEIGARVVDESGRRLAPVDVVLETDSRDPSAMHAILDMYVRHGLTLPDTPTMALFRGRIDLLESHLVRDPGLLTRKFSHEEIFPPGLGCHDEVLATHGTPLKGATLLHLAIDYDEFEIAQWLLAQGMSVDVAAAIDADGFGGHTALFATVVSQPNYWMNHSGAAGATRFTRLLLDHGANPNARASLRKKMHPGYGFDTLREYRDVTPLTWGQRFHFRKLVSESAMQLIEQNGGGP